MGLKSIYDNLKDQGFLSKFNSYDDFLLDIFNRTTLSKKINGLYKLLASQNASDKIIDKAVYLEKDIIPSYVLYNPLIKDHFNFVFDLLKSEGYLSKVKDIHSFIEYIDNSKVKKKIFEFLYKLGYSTTPNLTSVTNKLIEDYLKSQNKLVSNLNKIIEASIFKDIDQFFDLDKTFLITIEIENLKEAFALKYYNNYLRVKFKKETIKISVDFDQLIIEINLLLKLSPKNKNALQLLKSIDQEKSIRSKKQKEFDDFLNVLKSDNKKLEKQQPIASYTEDFEDVVLEDVILKEDKRYFDIVRVGKIIFNGEQYPVTLPFFKNGGFIWHLEGNNYNKVHSAIQNIALRIVMSLPKGHVKLKIIDEDFGSSFQMLLGLPNSIIGEQVYYDDKEVLQLFDELKKRDSNVIFSKLKNEFPDLLSFNKTREYEFEPIEIFVINGFPKFFNDQFVDYIYNQVKKGCRTGAYFLIAYDPSNISDYIKTDNLAKLSKGLSVIPNTLSEFYSSVNTDTLQAFEFTLDNELVVPDYVVNKFSESVSDSNNRSETAETNQSSDKSHSTSSAEGVVIQIGTTSKGKAVNFEFGQEQGEAQHGFICGNTGSGKTMLLHNIILEGSEKYAPNELQFVLLDYKQGNSFDIYKDLPHAKIVGVKQDFHFALEVLKYLDNVMKIRAELFNKSNSAADLIEYRKNNKLEYPARILIIIDEFQKLFADAYDNSHIHDELNKIFDQILRQGRSYGIHLLLSTQSPNNIKWNNSLKDFIAIRIGLKMSQSSESILFTHDNPIAANIRKDSYEAVYNGEGGIELASVVFKSLKVNKAKLKNRVEALKLDYADEKWRIKDRTVFTHSEKINRNDICLTSITPLTSNKELDIYLGKQNNVGFTDVSIKLNESNTQNILLLGSNTIIKDNLLKSILIEFLSKSKNVEIFWHAEHSNFEKLKNTKCYSNIHFSKGKDSLKHLLTNLHATLIEKDNVDRIIFIQDDVSALREFGNEYLDKSEKWEKRDKTKISEIYLNILINGPSQGLTTIMTSNEANHIDNFFDSKQLWNEFDHIISTQGANISQLSNYNTKWIELDDNSAILHNRTRKSSIKFNSVNYKQDGE